MADEVQAIEQPQQDASAQLAEQMKLAGIVSSNPTAPAPIAQQAQQAAPTEPQPNITPATVDAPPVNIFDTFKEKFGYEKPEDAIKEIEELRILKANPTPAQIKYENEQSEKLHKAIQTGDRKQVLQILNQQERIDTLTATEVNKDTAADIVKMGMQLKYKDLTPEEINYKFNKQFALPSKPVQTDVEDDAEYQQRVSQWQETVSDKTMELMIEAKLAKPEIETAKTKLELPTIDTPVDNDYLDYKKQQEESVKLDEQTKAAYKAFSPDTIKMKIDFNDEANKINFPFEFVPDAESFKKAVDTVSDADLFYKQFFNSDGSPNRQKYLEFVYYGQNIDKIIQSAITQGSNARFKAQLPDNSGNGMVRLMPQNNIELSELDKQMQLAGVKRVV